MAYPDWLLASSKAAPPTAQPRSSEAFVDAANQVKSGVEVPYAFQMAVEGDAREAVIAKTPGCVPLDRLQFVQGDACYFSEPWAQ